VVDIAEVEDLLGVDLEVEEEDLGRMNVAHKSGVFYPAFRSVIR
jgi:hypothetical protein